MKTLGDAKRLRDTSRYTERHKKKEGYIQRQMEPHKERRIHTKTLGYREYRDVNTKTL